MRPDKTLDKSSINGFIKRILGTVQEIQPLLHRTKFSGDYTYGDVEETIGELKIDDKFGEKAIRLNYSYKKKACRTIEGGRVVFYFKTFEPYNDPLLGYLKPRCIVETSNSTPKVLSKLHTYLPDLRVMSVEYTIDFYCRDHIEVSDLFFLFRRYAYIPYAKRTSMVGGEFQGYDHGEVTRQTNAVYKVHFQEKGKGKVISSGKYFKIYERGDDNSKIKLSPGKNRKKVWRHEDTNRVRLEFTFNRKSGTLAKNGIKSLKNLLQGPKFQQLFFPKSVSPESESQDQIQFRNFIDRKDGTLPKNYQDYATKDPQGNEHSFMVEYLAAKKTGINLSRETEPTQAFSLFLPKIIRETKVFDQEWKKKVKNLGII